MCQNQVVENQKACSFCIVSHHKLRSTRMVTRELLRNFCSPAIFPCTAAASKGISSAAATPNNCQTNWVVCSVLLDPCSFLEFLASVWRMLAVASGFGAGGFLLKGIALYLDPFDWLQLQSLPNSFLPGAFSAIGCLTFSSGPFAKLSRACTGATKRGSCLLLELCNAWLEVPSFCQQEVS